MSKIITAALTVIYVSSLAYAQNPTLECHLIYGNRDGSTIDVYLDHDIAIEVWAATIDTSLMDEDCECVGFDSINFMHNPLASNDSIITSRDGGAIEYRVLFEWDYVSFLPPDSNHPVVGYTNESLLGFANTGGPDNTNIFTRGDTVLITIRYMHTTADSTFLNQLVCPFMEGFNPLNGGLLWGMQDGITAIFPEQTFSCLYFVDYLPGDANRSGAVNGLDVIYMVGYLKGLFPPPDPIYAGDANGDCQTNGSDVIYLVAYLKGGPEPFLGNCH